MTFNKVPPLIFHDSFILPVAVVAVASVVAVVVAAAVVEAAVVVAVAAVETWTYHACFHA